MMRSHASLTVGIEQIEASDVWVAEAAAVVVGIVSLAATANTSTIDLDKLFVEPLQMKSGSGRALMQFAIEEARRRGFQTMTILADPNAAAFYERMGASFVRHAPSDAIPGRTLPLYELKL